MLVNVYLCLLFNAEWYFTLRNCHNLFIYLNWYLGCFHCFKNAYNALLCPFAYSIYLWVYFWRIAKVEIAKSKVCLLLTSIFLDKIPLQRVCPIYATLTISKSFYCFIALPVLFMINLFYPFDEYEISLDFSFTSLIIREIENFKFLKLIFQISFSVNSTQFPVGLIVFLLFVCRLYQISVRCLLLLFIYYFLLLYFTVILE